MAANCLHRAKVETMTENSPRAYVREYDLAGLLRMIVMM